MNGQEMKTNSVKEAKKIILDPVMVAKGGAKLIDNKAIKNGDANVNVIAIAYSILITEMKKKIFQNV